MPNSTRKCKGCSGYYVRTTPGVKTTSYWFHDQTCLDHFMLRKREKEGLRLLAKIRKNREKEERQTLKEKRDKLKGSGHWAQLAQRAVNSYVLKRDAHQPCISCGKYEHELTYVPGKGGKFDAGHYKTVGGHPELRFDLRNINKQCKACNRMNGGFVEGQKFGIVQRYGKARLDWLNGPHPAKNYTIHDLKRMGAIFRKKAKRFNTP